MKKMNKKQEWWKKSVVYQVYPKSFYDSNGDGFGDIRGIKEKIPYLAKLGADVIWLNPIFMSPQVDNGYDIADYKKIEPSLGTMDDFDELLECAHAHNIKIILDLVVNHTSDQHKWFQEAKKSRENPYHDYYIWKDKEGDQLPTNWGSSFGGSTWEYVEEVDQYYLHCFAKGQPDLNWENEKVRTEVYDMMKFWFEKGIDGFRMDVISLLSKDPSYPDGPIIQNKAYGSYYAGCANGPRVHEFLHEMNEKVLSKYDVMTVGETPHTNSEEAILYTGEGREELDMVFHFDHMHLDYDENGKYATNRVKLTDLKNTMTEWQEKMYAAKGWNSLYWSNHDQARAVSRFGNESAEYREISAKMLATLLHMMQGTPYIYEGEEIGMTNAHFDKIEDYRDVEALDIYKDFIERKGFSPEDTLHLLSLKSRDNARTPMQWNDSENAGFTSGTPWIAVNKNYKEINVERTLADKNSIFYYYQKLIALRHEMPIITEGKYQLVDAENEKVYTYLRMNGEEELVVICNFTEETIEYSLNDLKDDRDSQLVISNYEEAPSKMEDTIILQPYGAYVYLKK
jgi:oligo-1,6-glucosidase